MLAKAASAEGRGSILVEWMELTRVSHLGRHLLEREIVQQVVKSNQNSLRVEVVVVVIVVQN